MDSTNDTVGWLSFHWLDTLFNSVRVAFLAWRGSQVRVSFSGRHSEGEPAETMLATVEAL